MIHVHRLELTAVDRGFTGEPVVLCAGLVGDRESNLRIPDRFRDDHLC